MKIIDEGKMYRNIFGISKLENLLLTENFRDTINEVYNIKDNNPFESSVNATTVSVDLCQAINELMNKNCAIAYPVYNIENIIIDFNRKRYNITNLELSDITDSYNGDIIITPSNIYYKLSDIIREKYSFIN